MDVREQVENDFKEAMSEQQRGVSLMQLADHLEKVCAPFLPFTAGVLRAIGEARKKNYSEEMQKKIEGIPATVLFAPECHPESPTLAIYRNGFVYLACATCSGAVGHLKIGD